MGCEPARIAKTLSFAVDGGCVLIVCAGDAKIDNAKFKAQFHTKATMLTPEQVLDNAGALNIKLDGADAVRMKWDVDAIS